MFELTEEQFNECEEMEKRKQEADRKELEEQSKLLNVCHWGVVPPEQRVICNRKRKQL